MHGCQHGRILPSKRPVAELAALRSCSEVRSCLERNSDSTVLTTGYPANEVRIAVFAIAALDPLGDLQYQRRRVGAETIDGPRSEITTKRNSVVRLAREQGIPVREIVQAAGINRQRLNQVLGRK